MPDPHIIRLAKKNYLYAIEAVVGSNLFKHMYVRDTRTNDEFDAMTDGDKACAYMVSSVLALHGLIDHPHATVPTTIDKMVAAGWRKTDSPRWGDVIIWPSRDGHMHIGFYINEHVCVSNSSQLRVPIKHALQMQDGRQPAEYYTNDILHEPQHAGQ
jgi:hypothetical protein